jgi:hypothetical protein
MTITSEVGRRYRIDRPTFPVIMRDLRVPERDPGPGDPIPHLDLPTTDGGRFSNATIAANGRPVVLVFGSLTCPVTESAGAGLVQLARTYSQVADFVVVNVREAHPGRKIPQPQTVAEKTRNAAALKAHHGFDFDVAIDDLDGTVHRAFGTRPSSAYLLDPSGTIVFRAHWSNSVSALGKALQDLLNGRIPTPATAGQTVRALTTMAAYAKTPLDTAGPGALRDFWRAAPPAAALVTLAKLFHSLPPRRRIVPTVVSTLVVSVAACAGLLMALS